MIRKLYPKNYTPTPAYIYPRTLCSFSNTYIYEGQEGGYRTRGYRDGFLGIVFLLPLFPETEGADQCRE
jgi:hypothetical protein